jgi:mannose-6-phosphate isomerase
VHKPWGSKHLLPWSAIDPDDEPVGELWFQRANAVAPDAALLLKLLFTSEKLSIQVHPDDTFAQSIGMPHGKTEAWYILSATADGAVAVGLERSITTNQFRTSIEDGSIADLVQWRSVRAGDVIFVPAGTIHAIGAGLVLAEIQQNSDATFRLFDYGRQRDLHIANAVAVAHAEPAEAQVDGRRLTDARTLLLACPYFVLERIDLAPNSRWELDATGETWLLVLDGYGQVGVMNVSVGVALFVETDRVTIETGPDGLSGLVAYVGTEPRPDLLAEHTPKQSTEARS